METINGARKKHCLKQTENDDTLSTNSTKLMKHRRKPLGKCQQHQDELRNLNLAKAVKTSETTTING